MLSLTTNADGTRNDCPIGGNPCIPIDLPGAGATVDRGKKVEAEPLSWFGSLASSGAEQSGLQYKRNRFFDPKRGQFTQVDPIGLGGGLNLYGFASGDAVNFDDPFGLCPRCDEDGKPTWGALARQWINDRLDDALTLLARANAALNPMAGVAGAMAGRSPITGEKVSPLIAVGMVADAALGVAGGPAIEIAAGKTALARLMAGEFKVMAGAGTSVEFRAAAGLGGNAADWSYVTSKEVWEHAGYRYQGHWAVNTVTGETSMAKLKLLGRVK
jgi:RHS repeat-associated protein